MSKLKITGLEIIDIELEKLIRYRNDRHHFGIGPQINTAMFRVHTQVMNEQQRRVEELVIKNARYLLHLVFSGNLFLYREIVGDIVEELIGPYLEFNQTVKRE